MEETLLGDFRGNQTQGDACLPHLIHGRRCIANIRRHFDRKGASFSFEGGIPGVFGFMQDLNEFLLLLGPGFLHWVEEVTHGATDRLVADLVDSRQMAFGGRGGAARREAADDHRNRRPERFHADHDTTMLDCIPEVERVAVTVSGTAPAMESHVEASPAEWLNFGLGRRVPPTRTLESITRVTGASGCTGRAGGGRIPEVEIAHGFEPIRPLEIRGSRQRLDDRGEFEKRERVVPQILLQAVIGDR